MKKIITLCAALAVFLLCSQKAFAVEPGKVYSITATGTKTEVEVSGTVESDDVFAVVVQLRDKAGNIISMESTGVSSKSFSITLSGVALTPETEYDVFGANYEGGDWMVASFTVPKDEDPGNTPGNDPGNDPGNTPGNDPGNTPGNAPGNTPGNAPGNTPNNKPANDGNAGKNSNTDSDNNAKDNEGSSSTVTDGENESTGDSTTSIGSEEKNTANTEEKINTSESREEKDTSETEEKRPNEELEKDSIIPDSIAIEDEKKATNVLKICLLSFAGLAVAGAASYFIVNTVKKHGNDE